MNELLFAQLCAMVVNTSARAPEKPMTIEKFMPSRWTGKADQSKAPRKRSKKVVQREIVDFWRAMASTAVVKMPEAPKEPKTNVIIEE